MDAPPRWRLIECDPPRRLPDEVVLEESSEPEIDEEIAQRPVFVYESHLAEQIRKRREAVQGDLPQAASGERDPGNESFAADSLVRTALPARAPRASRATQPQAAPARSIVGMEGFPPGKQRG